MNGRDVDQKMRTLSSIINEVSKEPFVMKKANKKAQICDTKQKTSIAYSL